MLRRSPIVCALLSITLLTSGCAYLYNKHNKKYFYPNNAPSVATPLTYSLADFDNIVVNTPLDITLIKSAQTQVTATALPIDLQNFNPHVEQRTLYLDAKKPVNNGTVTIRLPALANLTLCAPGNVRIDKVAITNLQVNPSQAGQMKIEGEINPDNLKITNNSKEDIKIGWLDSKNIDIAANNGLITLVGRTQLLTAQLTGSAAISAKFLRALAVDIKTQDKARADVTPIDRLTAKTCNNSNIYYYKTPNEISISSDDASNVLKVAQWK